MGRRRYHKKSLKLKQYRVNSQITAQTVKLIDPDQGFVGIVSLNEALKRAKDKELDLIEVSPKEDPPVVKILDYGKFKYELEKKKQKSKSKKSEIKGIRISMNIAEHDLETKENQARKFVANGHKIRLEMVLRGREMAHVKRAFEQMEDFIKKLEDSCFVIQDPIKKGRRITALLNPKK